MKQLIIFIFITSILIGCGGSAEAPKTFIETHDEGGVWKNVEVRDGLEKEELWRKVVDALTHDFDVEVLDKDSGYLRSAWKYSYVSSTKRYDQYRNRITVKFIGDDWKVVQLKVEANWFSKSAGDWVLGYDSQLLRDVYTEL